MFYWSTVSKFAITSKTDLVFLPRSDDLKPQETFLIPVMPILQLGAADNHEPVLPIALLPDECF